MRQDIEGNQENDSLDDARDLAEKAGTAKDAVDNISRKAGRSGEPYDDSAPQNKERDRGNTDAAGKNRTKKNGSGKADGKEKGEAADRAKADSSQAISSASAANEGAAKNASVGSVGSSAGKGAAASSSAGTAAGAGASGAAAGAAAGAKAGTTANPGVGTAVGAAAGCLSGCLKPLLKGCLAAAIAGVVLGAAVLYVLSTSAITLIKEGINAVTEMFDPDPMVKLADALDTTEEELYGFGRVLELEDELYKKFDEECNEELDELDASGKYESIYIVDTRRDIGDDTYPVDLLIIYMMEAGRENRELLMDIQEQMNGMKLTDEDYDFYRQMSDAVVLDATDFESPAFPALSSKGLERTSSYKLNQNIDVMKKTFKKMTRVDKQEHVFEWDVSLTSPNELTVTVSNIYKGKVVKRTEAKVPVDEHGGYGSVTISCSFEDSAGTMREYSKMSAPDLSSFFYQETSEYTVVTSAPGKNGGNTKKGKSGKKKEEAEEDKEVKTSGAKEENSYPICVASGQYTFLEYVIERWTQDKFMSEYPFDEMETMDYEMFNEANYRIGNALGNILDVGSSSLSTSFKRIYTVSFDPESNPVYATAVGNTKWKAVHNATEKVGWIYTQNKEPYENNPSNKYTDPTLGYTRMDNGYTDCSSLVYRAYKEAGYSMEGQTTTRTEASWLLEHGATVVSDGYCDPHFLLPGDLIFYSNGKDVASIYHVAMFYGMDEAGNSWIIEARVPYACYSDYMSHQPDKIWKILRPNIDGDLAIMVGPE